MSEITDIVRIKKVEKLDGTYYYPQKRVWKTRWFSESGYEWETFFLVTKSIYGKHENCFVPPFEVRGNKDILNGYKKIEWAEYNCKEYLRVHHSDEVVKTWSTED